MGHKEFGNLITDCTIAVNTTTFSFSDEVSTKKEESQRIYEPKKNFFFIQSFAM
jgi:hypothetical protein